VTWNQPDAPTARPEPVGLRSSSSQEQSSITNGGHLADETPRILMTKPTTGPPVYYPPDHEMFIRKEAPVAVNTLVDSFDAIASLPTTRL